MTKKEKAVYDADYNKKNRDSIKLKRADYYKKNVDIFKAKSIIYRKEHKEEIRANNLIYRKENREKIKKTSALNWIKRMKPWVDYKKTLKCEACGLPGKSFYFFCK